MNDNYYNTVFDPSAWVTRTGREHSRLDNVLIETINASKPNLVIDAGCGHNRFRDHIPSLIGFDRVAFPNAHLHTSILDAKFEPESADHILALGSIQFESRDYVKANLQKVIEWLKPGGLLWMRVRTGPNAVLGKKGKLPEEMRYNWTLDDIDIFSQEFGLETEKPLDTRELKLKIDDLDHHRQQTINHLEQNDIRDPEGVVRGSRWNWVWKKV